MAPPKISIMSYTPFPSTVCTPFPISTTPTLARTHNDFLLPYTANKCNKVNKTKHTWLVARSSVSSTDSLYDFIKLITINVIFLTWKVKGSQRSSHFIDYVSKIRSL